LGEERYTCGLMVEEKRPFPERILQRHKLLALIIFLFLIMAGVYNYLIPPFEGPDEPQHFAYAQWLAEGNGLPPQGLAAWETPLEQEASQPPLYYFLAAIPIKMAALDDPPATYRPNPHYPAPFPHKFPDNENRAIHYGTDTRPLQGAWLGLYVARAVTLLFGILLLVATYGLARQILPDRPNLALGATFLVAFTPQVLFLSTMVSNDIPAAAFSALTLWGLAVWLRQEKAAPWPPLLTGLALGLAGLTKVSALLLALPIGAGLLWWRLSRRQSWSTVLRDGALFALALTAVAGWWFLHNWLTFGSPVGLDTHTYAPWSLTQDGVLVQMGERWVEVVRSAWLALGWGAVRPADWAYLGLFLFLALAIVGLLRFTRQTYRARQPEWDRALALTGLLLLTFVIVALFLEVWMRQVVAVHGRLLFPALAASAILLVLGWHSLHPRLPRLAYLYQFIWAALVPLLLLRPAYHATLLLPAEIETVSPRLGWLAWEEGSAEPLAEIIQVNVPQPTAVAGSVVPVEVCWQALSQTETDYSIMIQFIGPGNGLAAARRTYPAHGLHPTSQWQPGDAACETLHVLIPPELNQTLVYEVEINLIDNNTGQRLANTNADGLPLPFEFVDKIRLEAQDTRFTTLVEVESSPIQLLDQTFDTVWRAGETATVSLSWATPTLLTDDYQVFVHLRHPESDEIVAQADGPPLDGWYPTSWWLPGEIVSEVRAFTIPADLANGRYTLITGFYDLASGERLGLKNILGEVLVTGGTD
jgi:4-amino-4-deoxy-L-arabinose transferase-like glycosyltransferase